MGNNALDCLKTAILVSVLGLFLVMSFAPVKVWAQQESLWSFSTIRTDANADDTLDYLGRRVTVTGIANISTGILHEHYLQAFIQNDSTGMSIFSQEIKTPFSPGDSIVASGHIQRYNGLAEVDVDSYKVFKGASERPAPKPLEKAIYHPQNYLGMLVEGDGRIVGKGSTYNGRYIRVTDSDTSSASLMVYVSNFHDLSNEFDFEVLSIGDEISVTGVVTEYNPEYPNQRTYKVFLRTPDDLKYTALPRYYWLMGGGILLIIFIVIGGWIISLRRQVDKQTRELQKSLEEKETLLNEIHHRVKNSLSIVSGLIGLQIDSTDNKGARQVLQDSQSRIQSVALIHQKLYQLDSTDEVRLDIYVKDLVEAIHGTFAEYTEAVDLKFDMDSVRLDVEKVIPCGLLINELVVNAFKHAFSKNSAGLLKVTLEQENGQIELSVADNGPGLPEDFSMGNSDSLGSMLIDTFASQLEAETEIIESDDGTEFAFRFYPN